MLKKTIGGDRLGAGKKMTVNMHGYGRSTFNLDKVVRLSQAPGTLNPVDVQIGLNGDTFDFDLMSKIRTLPTNGPIFGSFKQQIDVFVVPMRLYISALHNNMLGIGMKMDQVLMPKLNITASEINFNEETPPNIQQINPSSLLAHLGIKGLGRVAGSSPTIGATRSFNAIPFLAYWDIYKNYYANKQEEKGVVIAPQGPDDTWTETYVYKSDQQTLIFELTSPTGLVPTPQALQKYDVIILTPVNGVNNTDIKTLKIQLTEQTPQPETVYKEITEENGWLVEKQQNTFKLTNLNENGFWYVEEGLPLFQYEGDSVITLTTFPLSNIDDMRESILGTPFTEQFYIDTAMGAKLPYRASISTYIENTRLRSTSYLTQCGLGIKTYLSDRFNNWLSTEWIDGPQGIANLTAIRIDEGKFTLDALNLQQKIYNTLNRVATSGGSYNDWQEAVWGEETARMAESPIYVGGMSQEIVFDEVVSTADTESTNGQMPLGSLAGRGTNTNKKDSGTIHIRIKEPSIIMTIASITPRVDYSQGNKWFYRLNSMNDLHKPELDGIGFQELITEEMAAWNTDTNGVNTTYYSAGKQPAYMEYRTEVNECLGNFADPKKEMFMTLNRNYGWLEDGSIYDLTTYIDPAKYNYAFADARLDAMNFWVQIGLGITARRKMSATEIPNL